LKQIDSYFVCGRIGKRTEREMCYFEVTDFYSIWHIIIPHFLNFPFYGVKQNTFIKFVHALTLLYPSFNKDKPKLLLGKLIYLTSDMNTASNRTEYKNTDLYKKINIRPEEIIVNLKPLSNTLNYFNPLLALNVFFIIGVIEGDGSFYIGLRENRKVRFGFSITTHIHEIDLLYKIKWFLNCGIAKSKTNTWCRYEIESSNSLRNILIPLVNTIPLLSSKSVNFKVFKEAMDLYTKKEHLSDEGLIRLVKLAYANNTKGKRRKYTLEGYLKKNHLSNN